VEMGPLPSSQEVIRNNLDAAVARYEKLLLAIEKPVTDAEARALISVFGQDDAFGLAWTLVSLVESAPGWPLSGCLPEASDNAWVALLRDRAGKTPRS
jgi:hypothetical protein